MSMTVGEFRGRDLPQQWKELADVNPEETYTVTLQSAQERRASVERLQQLMDQISEEAERNGMMNKY
ncbi:MAG: hypothetical protein HQL56_15090 [Magnetococcales bacterium]|nr:hypothetical protein [Magnetococcales bacterium]